ncbi:MAG: ABC transporter substrate-binding protein, partial [Thermovirgaceae bacterium]
MKRIPGVALALLVLLLATPLSSARADLNVEAIKGPKIEELYMVIHRDPDSQILALERGELDVLGDITRPVDIDRLAKNEGVELSISRGFHLFFMGFNLRESPWNSLPLRKAVAHAIPKQQIVRDLFSGYSEPVSTYLPPVSPYYEPDVATYPYDPSRAKALLKEAGWSWNGEGRLVPPGSKDALETLKLLTPAAQSAPTTMEIGRRIADALEAIGLPVELEPLDFSVMIRRLDVH